MQFKVNIIYKIKTICVIQLNKIIFTIQLKSNTFEKGIELQWQFP